MKLLFTFLLLSSVCFGQSKKEQIEALNHSVDSLNTVLATTRDNSDKDIRVLNDKIKKVTDEVTTLKGELTNLQTSNNKLTKENEKFKTDLGELSKKNLELEAKLEAVELEKTSFKTVKIGNQVWMAENLNVDKFLNGDPIPEAKTEEEWRKAGVNGQPAWCYYDNDPANGAKYGKLYNLYAVNDARGLAPGGWHISTDEERSVLQTFIESNYDEDLMAEINTGRKTSQDEFDKLTKSKFGWGQNGNGTDDFGLKLMPGGSRSSFGIWGGEGAYGYWWEKSYGGGSYFLVSYDLVYEWYWDDLDDTDSFGFSVRCLRD
jgi:uncharacterized protein (TIGR02145 family)